MSSSVSKIILAVIVVVVAVAGIVIAIRQAPSADEGLATVEEEAEFTAVTPATVWGTVTYSDGSIASGITVTIGGVGQITNSKGEYAVSVYQIGTVPVQFESGKDTLLTADATQAEVSIVEGTSIHHDFIIQKITN